MITRQNLFRDQKSYHLCRGISTVVWHLAAANIYCPDKKHICRWSRLPQSRRGRRSPFGNAPGASVDCTLRRPIYTTTCSKRRGGTLIFFPILSLSLQYFFQFISPPPHSNLIVGVSTRRNPPSGLAGAWRGGAKGQQGSQPSRSAIHDRDPHIWRPQWERFAFPAAPLHLCFCGSGCESPPLATLFAPLHSALFTS